MSLSLALPEWRQVSGRHRDAWLLDRHMIALLHGWARRYRLIPPQHVGIGGKIDGLPFEARDPRPGSHIRYRIVAGQVGRLGQPPVQHTVQPLALLEIALLRVRGLALVVFHEMVHLAQHRADPAHLPHQPLDGAPPRILLFGPELAGLLGEVHQDCTRFEQRAAVVAVDDRRNAVVRADLQEMRLELLVLIDVDGMHRIFQPAFLQHDGHLAAVRESTKCRDRSFGFS